MNLIYLAELTVYDPSLPGTRVLRFATGAKGLTTAPTESPANTHFQPRIITPASLSFDVVADGRTFGQSTVGVGEMVLNNADGALDGLMDYGFDGRPLVIRLGPEGAAYPAGFTTVLVGTMEQPEFNWTRVTVRLRDRQAELQRALQQVKYAGTNTGATGVEGTADDIAGSPKPLCYGRCLNVSAVPANTAALIYQVHAGAIDALEAVYDKGVAITANVTTHATLGALQAGTPGAGQYDACLPLGLFKLGSSPSGRVTADVRGDKTGGTYANKAGDIAQRLLTGPGGIASGDVPSAVITALNSANGSEIGFFASSETTVAEALDSVLGGIGAWWSFDRLGQFNAAVLVAPVGTPVLSITEQRLISGEMLVTNDAGRGLPCTRVLLDYGRNNTVQGGDALAGAVTPARRAFLEKEWRTTSATDASVLTKHLLAPELQQQSLLNSDAAAATEATRRLDLYKVRRDYWRVRVWMDPTVAVIDLGSVVEMKLGRFGYAAGRKFVVLGVDLDASTGFLTLKLWG